MPSRRVPARASAAGTPELAAGPDRLQLDDEIAALFQVMVDRVRESVGDRD
jgi:hypothetical protein